MDKFKFLKNYLESSSLKLDQYEIYGEEKQRQSFQSKEGRIEQIEESLEQGISLRLFQGNRQSFACTSDLSQEGLIKMAEAALDSLPLLSPDTPFSLPDAVSFTSSFSHTENPTREEKREAVLLLERSARDFDARISKVRDVRFEEEIKKIVLMNSHGLEVSFQDRVYENSLMVVAENSQGQEMAWESDFNHDFYRLDAEALGRLVAQKAVTLLGAQTLPTQKTRAIFDPLVTSAFLNVLAQSFCADQVYKGRSYLKDKLQRHVYSPSINIIEDPLYEKSYDRAPFDAEGIPSQKTVLVEKGYVKNLMSDIHMAAILKIPSTGHSVRSSYKESPRISPRHFTLMPGRFSTAELQEEMGKGFYVQDIIGAHTIDSVSGDFSVGATGLWIEKGKQRSAVRGVTISGNLHDIFRKVDKVGSLIHEYQSFGAASLLISSLDVAGS